MAHEPHWVIYFIPLLPIVTRAALIICFRNMMGNILSEDEQDREAHRAPILAFAGFAFTGVVALAVLEPTIKQSVHRAVFFLLVSFLAYMWAFNAQGYKGRRWEGEMASALGDVGSLCIILALVDLLATSNLGLRFVVGSSILAFAVWGLDHGIRLALDASYLGDLNVARKRHADDKKSDSGR